MKVLMLITTLILVGCSSAPVKPKFPDVPAGLLQACPDLKQTEQTTKLSEVLKIVVSNYGQYHECQIKNDTWAEWYKTQRDIYEEQ